MFDAIRDCLLHFVTAAALGKSYQSSAHDGGLSPPHKSKHKSKHRTNTKVNVGRIRKQTSQVSWKLKFLSDPSTIIGNACHSLTH